MNAARRCSDDKLPLFSVTDERELLIVLFIHSEKPSLVFIVWINASFYQRRDISVHLVTYHTNNLPSIISAFWHEE